MRQGKGELCELISLLIIRKKIFSVSFIKSFLLSVNISWRCNSANLLLESWQRTENSFCVGNWASAKIIYFFSIYVCPLYISRSGSFYWLLFVGIVPLLFADFFLNQWTYVHYHLLLNINVSRYYMWMWCRCTYTKLQPSLKLPTISVNFI